MKPLEVLLLYNEPALAADDPDWASEAGVLESVDAVSTVLTSYGHRVRALGLGPTVAGGIDSLAELGHPDVVFNLFEGFSGVGYGESEVAGLVELSGHAMTGSPAACLALVRDKPRTKWLLAGAGLPTPAFVLVGKVDRLDEPALDRLLAKGPVIVKPAHEDASLGIAADNIVTELSPLRARIEAVRARYGAVLVEQFVIGREFNAAIRGLEQDTLLPLAEIEFCGPGQAGWQIVTYDAKWAIGSEADQATPARCPAQVDTATSERIGQTALAAFRLCGCRDYARVDLRMDAAGNVYILEINGNPDIDPTAGYARALKAAGISYERFVLEMVEWAAATRGRKVASSMSTASIV